MSYEYMIRVARSGYCITTGLGQRCWEFAVGNEDFAYGIRFYGSGNQFSRLLGLAFR
jgi:hypothetical protein